jgi:pyruvate dehydrogenase E1 component alpha subunit
MCDGKDFFEVRKSMQGAVTRARNGQGPTLIECKTYRQSGHSRLDDGSTYRPREEIQQWLKRDRIVLMREELLRRKLTDKKIERQIEERVVETINQATEQALTASFPPVSEAFEDVYCGN